MAKFEEDRRYATLAAVAIETRALLIDLHDRMFIAINRAKHKHEQQFQGSGKAINEKVRLYGRIGSALVAAKSAGTDAFAAIEGSVALVMRCRWSA